MSKNLKTLICCILALVFVSGTLIAVFADSTGAFTTEAASEAESGTDVDVATYEMGDVNRDGKISAADARLTLRASAKLEALDAQQRELADVIPDGVIIASDARLILRVSAKLEPKSILGSEAALNHEYADPTTVIVDYEPSTVEDESVA